mgnify:CR=1 FL=1
MKILNSLWNDNKKQIYNEVRKEKKTISKYEEILENVYKKMKDFLDEISDEN